MLNHIHLQKKAYFTPFIASEMKGVYLISVKIRVRLIWLHLTSYCGVINLLMLYCIVLYSVLHVLYCILYCVYCIVLSGPHKYIYS